MPLVFDLFGDPLSPGLEAVRALGRVVEVIDEPGTPIGELDAAERTEIRTLPVRRISWWVGSSRHGPGFGCGR